MFRKNDVVYLRVDALGVDAQGVCRYEGIVVFVAGALPGEHIRAMILSIKKNYAYAKLLDVLEPSPHRVTPPCPYFGRCGGCSCQHMDYAYTLEYKRGVVAQAMLKIAGVDSPVDNTLGMEDPWQYRNKTATPVQCSQGQAVTGFYAPRSHRLIRIENCLIAMPPADDIAAVVRKWMEDNGVSAYDEATCKGDIRHVVSRANRQGESMALLVVNCPKLPFEKELIRALIEGVPGIRSISYSVNTKHGNTILGSDSAVVWGSETLEETLCGITFRVSPMSFFQVNPWQTEALYKKALELAAPAPNQTVADVYCGAGTIALCFAPYVKDVVGVEIVPEAVSNARVNAVANSITNASFITGDASQELPKLVSEGFRPDIVLLDPPRKGAPPEVLNSIVQAGPEKIVYISCHPATQARDAAFLVQHGYQVKSNSPVDMFCFTSGIENIMLLTKEN